MYPVMVSQVVFKLEQSVVTNRTRPQLTTKPAKVWSSLEPFTMMIPDGNTRADRDDLNLLLERLCSHPNLYADSQCGLVCRYANN